MLMNIEQVQKEQAKEAKIIANNLKKSWNDDVSLINLYTDLKVKGWFPQQIHQVYNELEKLGVKFSGQQEADRTKLGTNPIIPIRYLSK